MSVANRVSEDVVNTATAKFDEYVAANEAATGFQYITTNEQKAIMAEFGVPSQSFRAIWARTKYPEARRTSTTHPSALRDVIGFLKTKSQLAAEDLEALNGTHPNVGRQNWGGLIASAKRIIGGENEDEDSPTVQELPGMADVKVMLAHYDRSRLRVSKCRELFDRAALDLQEAEKELERYKPLAKQIESLQQLASRLKNGEA